MLRKFVARMNNLPIIIIMVLRQNHHLGGLIGRYNCISIFEREGVLLGTLKGSSIAKVASLGVDELICSHLTPLFSNFNCCISFYDLMLKNVENAIDYSKKVGIKAHFYLWVDPVLLKGGVSIEESFKTNLFEGLKIHPRLNTFSDAMMSKIFSTAENGNLPILIHIGVSDYDNPLAFERYFEKYSSAKVQLAHCKDSKAIIELFRKYPQLTGDTSFCPQSCLDEIAAQGFESRMLYASDFPIKEYYKNHR